MMYFVFSVLLFYKSFQISQFFVTEDGIFEYGFQESSGDLVLTNILQNIVGNIIIPSTIQHEGKNYAVTRLEINQNLVGNLTGDLKISDTVTTIGNNFFKEQEITSLHLGSGLKSIGDYCFAYCNKLKNIIFPSSLEVIGKCAFMETNINSFILPENSNLQIINDQAFFHTKLVGDIKFPQTLVQIGNECFKELDITSISFGTSAALEIGYSAFEKSKLNCDLKFTNDNLTIGYNCFDHTNITHFEVNAKNFVNILSYAFYKCSFLKKVKISQNLCGTRILQSSFEKCENLISFEANSLLNISSALVSECKNLETFTISGLFRDSKILVSTYGCPKLSEVSLSNANYLLLDAFVSVETLEYIYFYNSDINFSKYSFNNCPLFKNIILIGSKIDVIESFAFYKCPLLEFDSSISLRMESHAFQESCLQTFTFNVSVIPSYAISGSLTLKYIRITKTVTYISAHFIEQCPNFISLEFLDPESDGNDLIIGNEAFWKMDTFDLSSRLPKRLIKIGDEAFSGCSKITGSLFIPQKLTSIGNYAFANCIGLNGILDFTINNVLENISSYAFLGCSLRGSLVFPNSLKKIGACSFSYCKFNGPLVIPDNVNRIEKYAFALCSSFTGSLIIGNNVEYIGSFAFSECNGFNGQLEFHTKKLRRIGKNAFFLCSSLKGNLVLPNTLEWIGDFAFFDCHNLKGLSLPNSLLHIGDSTFAYCTGFTETLNLPKNLNHIGTNAFFQCEGFTKIEFDKQIASDKIIIGNKAFGNLKITCLSNVPKTCEGNASNTNRCYDSTNFAWYHTSSNIRESCSATEAVRITQRVIEIICSLGIIGIAYKIVKCIRQYCGKEKHLEAIFDELIQEAKENYEKDYRNQKINPESICNFWDPYKKSIEIYIQDELDNQNFKHTQNDLVKILNKSFQKLWPSAPASYKKHFIDNAFNGLELPKRKCCCWGKNDNNNNQTEQQVIANRPLIQGQGV